MCLCMLHVFFPLFNRPQEELTTVVGAHIVLKVRKSTKQQQTIRMTTSKELFR